MNYPILYKKGTSDFDNLGKAIIKHAKNLFIHQVINGEYTLEFDLHASDSTLNCAEYDDFIKVSGQLFRIRSISSAHNDDGSSYIHFVCYHVWYDACDCKYIPHAFTKSGSAEIDGWINVKPRWVLETVFSGTPFSVGDVEIDTPTDIFATKANPAEIVNILIENVGGELLRDNYTVHLKKGGQQYNGKHIVYGKNLKSIEKSMDDSAIITRLYPLGQDDMDISSVNNGSHFIDSPLANTYGYVKCGYRDFTNIDDPQKLLEEAKKLWSTDSYDGIDKPKITYTVQTPDLKNVALGDTVRVTDSELGIDILTKVSEITTYPMESHKGSITLSNHKDFSSNLSEKIVSGIASFDKILDSNGNIMSQYIDNVREKIQSQVQDATKKRLTVHKFGDIWVDNIENPTKAMMISEGIFAVANSKKTNGDWNWRTIGTADEFLADRISAPWLDAGFINTDEITVRSADGTALLSGNCFKISANDGSEAIMSSDEGFKYIYSRDEYGNPYDYVVFDHKGQKRYWHGHRIPSTYQFAKGTTYCTSYCTTYSNSFKYGIIKLEGPEWKEIARVYNKIIADTSLSDLEKSSLINTMIKVSTAPAIIHGNIDEKGAVVFENSIITRTIGNYEIPHLYEINESGTELSLSYKRETFYYDGAALLYKGAAGYSRGYGQSPYLCYDVEATYDVAITLDIDYE